jgi:hypothetical protein
MLIQGLTVKEIASRMHILADASRPAHRAPLITLQNPLPQRFGSSGYFIWLYLIIKTNGYVYLQLLIKGFY